MRRQFDAFGTRHFIEFSEQAVKLLRRIPQFADRFAVCRVVWVDFHQYPVDGKVVMLAQFFQPQGSWSHCNSAAAYRVPG